MKEKNRKSRRFKGSGGKSLDSPPEGSEKVLNGETDRGSRPGVTKASFDVGYGKGSNVHGTCSKPVKF